MKKAKIVTYPRSGANYLQNLLINNTGKKIEYFHEHDQFIKSDKTIISIARDPFDSIHSNFTMRKHYFPEEEFNNLYISHYIDIYTTSYEKSDIVIDYNDLISHPMIVVAKICELLEIQQYLDKKDTEFLADNKKYNYLVSSKTSKEYDKKHFDIEDITDCYAPYKNLLSRSINLTKKEF